MSEPPKATGPPAPRRTPVGSEEHWHGATPDRLMAHVAVLQSDADGTNATWLERVPDEEYGQQPG